MSKKVAEVIVEVLQEVGVKRCYGIVGLNSLAVALNKSDIQWVQVQQVGTTRKWVILFGPFRVTKARRLVERGGEPIHVGARAFDILVHLLERHGQVVSHRALLEAAWPGVIVEEVSLRFQMMALRKALGNGEARHDYIINVAGRGYCFTAPISRLDEASPTSILAGVQDPEPAS